MERWALDWKDVANIHSSIVLNPDLLVLHDPVSIQEMFALVRVCVYIYSQSVCVYIHSQSVCVYMCIYKCIYDDPVSIQEMFALVRVCVYTHIVRVCVYVFIHI